MLSHYEEPFGYAQDLRDAVISYNRLYYKFSRLLR
jgi:hypothetical protein